MRMQIVELNCSWTEFRKKHNITNNEVEQYTGYNSSAVFLAFQKNKVSIRLYKALELLIKFKKAQALSYANTGVDEILREKDAEIANLTKENQELQEELFKKQGSQKMRKVRKALSNFIKEMDEITNLNKRVVNK